MIKKRRLNEYFLICFVFFQFPYFSRTIFSGEKNLNFKTIVDLENYPIHDLSSKKIQNIFRRSGKL